MSNSMRRNGCERILLDMNTQCDFLLPKGALPVTNRAEVLPNIRKIMNWGRIRRDPILSSLESHRPGESVNGLPAYCVDRTKGQKKLPFTLMPRRILLQGDNTLDLPFEPFRRFQQVICTKRNCDFLSNPKADRLINTIQTKYLIVFGILAEQCIKVTVLGLLARRRKIIVVRDACGYWYDSEAELAFRQMSAKGAILATTEELLSGEAEAKINGIKKPSADHEVDDSPITPHGKGNGRTAEQAATTEHERPKSSGNGGQPAARPDRPRHDPPDPVDIPHRNAKSPAAGRTRSPHGLA